MGDVIEYKDKRKKKDKRERQRNHLKNVNMAEHTEGIEVSLLASPQVITCNTGTKDTKQPG